MISNYWAKLLRKEKGLVRQTAPTGSERKLPQLLERSFRHRPLASRRETPPSSTPRISRSHREKMPSVQEGSRKLSPAQTTAFSGSEGTIQRGLSNIDKIIAAQRYPEERSDIQPPYARPIGFKCGHLLSQCAKHSNAAVFSSHGLFNDELDAGLYRSPSYVHQHLPLLPPLCHW